MVIKIFFYKNLLPILGVDFIITMISILLQLQYHQYDTFLIVNGYSLFPLH